MIVWLWEAGSRYSGITDNPEQAKEAAAACLNRGDVTQVERAIWTLGADPVGSYVRTGNGWTTTRPWSGPMTWEELVVEPNRAAS